MYTQQEINIWKERAKNGPYKTKNDTFKNSPGDWERILSNANKFLTNPSQERVKFNYAPIQKGNNTDQPTYNGKLLRDAAFVYLITKDPKYLNAVESELLAQSRESSTDFSNPSQWPPNILTDLDPSFYTAEWLTRITNGYSYIRGYLKNTDEIDSWFLDAARYFDSSINHDLNKLFVDRKADNYEPSSMMKSKDFFNSIQVTHDNGHQTRSIHRWHNNRRGSQIKFSTLVGALLNDQALINSGKKYVKEWLKFAVYSDMISAEFVRGGSTKTEAGYFYTFYSLDHALSIADALARKGDFELYNFSTSDGVWGTEGGNKTLKKVALRLCELKRGDYLIKESGQVINGIEGNKAWCYEIWLAQYNIYWKDSYIRESIEMSLNHNYNLATAGPHQIWGGAWDTQPGVLFMFGNLEGIAVDPPVEEPKENIMKVNYNEIEARGGWTKADTHQVIYSNVVNASLFHNYVVDKKSTVKIALEKLHTHGIALVKIGSVEKMVDLYSEEKGDFILSETLEPGSHDIQIFVTGEKNPLSSNTYVVFESIELVDYVEPEVEPEIPPVEPCVVKRYKSVRKGNFRIRINGELTPDNYTEERTATAEATFLKYSKSSDVVEVIPPEKYVIE